MVSHAHWRVVRIRRQMELRLAVARAQSLVATFSSVIIRISVSRATPSARTGRGVHEQRRRRKPPDGRDSSIATRRDANADPQSAPGCREPGGAPRLPEARLGRWADGDASGFMCREG